jgi:SAM-dependent methyltransferase
MLLADTRQQIPAPSRLHPLLPVISCPPERTLWFQSTAFFLLGVTAMSLRLESISNQTSPSSSGRITPAPKTLFDAIVESLIGIGLGLQRRLRRERRRRAVGRAYDMALEIARFVPPLSHVLDVGCGNGFIAHHLSAMVRTSVVGIDLPDNTAAPIDYRRYDGKHFPIGERCFDAVLLCYVLHHADDFPLIMSEVRRVLRHGGLAVVYEDIPRGWWDRVVCKGHDLQWRKRTGPCKFHLEAEWRRLFSSAGFEIVTERRLSRWRNLTHPVCRQFFLLKLKAVN